MGAEDGLGYGWDLALEGLLDLVPVEGYGSPRGGAASPWGRSRPRSGEEEGDLEGMMGSSR